MERASPGQLDLPIREFEPADILHSPARVGELERLRARLPATIQFGTCGWAFPGWAGIVWHGRRTLAELEQGGLREYATHPLLTTMYLASGAESAPSERDLRRYAGQLPGEMHCILEVHPDLTTPRFPHARLSGAARGQAGQVNPRFLDSRFFCDEIWRMYRDVFGDKLGPFLFTFPPILKRAGISPEVFAVRLETFFAGLPEELEGAVELREPEYLTPEYAHVLAAFGLSHVFSTWAGMPSLAEQARRVPPGPEVMVQVVDPSGKGQGRAARLEPFDAVRAANQPMRDAIVELLIKLRTWPTYVLVHNDAEGCAPLTILAVARMLVDRLGR